MPIQRPRILHSAQMAGTGVVTPPNLNVRAQSLPNRNVIINGAMQVAQRATTVASIGTSSGYFTIDRFRLACNTGGRLTMSQDTSVPAGKGFGNSLKLDCTTADTSLAASELLTLNHRIEGQNLQGFAKGTSDAKSFAVSFYCKGNANATYVLEMQDKDNDRQISKTFNVTTSWAKVTLIFPPDTIGAFDNDNAESMQFQIWLTAGSTYTDGTINSNAWASTTNANRVGSGTTNFLDSTARTFFITGLQLEVGDTATEFEHESFERTLDKCRRYTFVMGGDGVYERYAVGYNQSSTQARCVTYYPTTMRANPTTSKTDPLIVASKDSPQTVNSISVDYNSKTVGHIQYNVSSGLSAGEGCHIVANNNANSRLTFDAEL